MRKNSKKMGGDEMSLRDLAWRNFIETGEIGAYMFYKKLSEENDERTDDSGDCPESD